MLLTLLGRLVAAIQSDTYHLVVASYDRGAVSSLDVLKSFNALNVEAKLIGPI